MPPHFWGGTLVFWTTESTEMVGKFEKHARPSSLTSDWRILRIWVLQMNSIDELFEHWISRCINMFRKSHINLPSKSPTINHQNTNPTESQDDLRLNNKSVEFSSPMTRSSQFPRQGLLSNRINIQIKSQMRNWTFRDIEIEAETDNTFVGFET